MLPVIRHLLPAALLAGCALGATPVMPIVNPVIVIEIAVPGVDAPEIERAVTAPLERAFNGLPGVITIRSATTWQTCRIELAYANRPTRAAVGQVTAVARSESARFDVAASKPVISVGPASMH